MADGNALDTNRLGAFGLRMRELMNGAATAMMLSIGHQAGLLDAMGRLPPSTSGEIAAAAGLQERYVREWLGAMVTGGIVEYLPLFDTYRLPPEHAAFLTRTAGPRNVATYMQFFPLLGSIEAQILDKFRNGGGVPYSEYTDFHRIMGEISAQRYDALLIDHVLPLVPGITHELGRGIRVADIGCGSGHALNLMAQAYPQSRFVGFDFSEEAVSRARAQAEELGLTNVTFVVRDVAELDGTDTFDFITTFDAIHDQAQPRRVVQGIHASLAPDGFWLCADISASSHVGENLDHPIGAFTYAISCMHCMTVSLAYDGEGLGAMWGVHTAREVFTEAGFVVESIHHVDGDAGNNYYVCRRPR